MSRSVHYVQCQMKRTTGGVVSQTTSYIPTRFAVLGKTLRLRGEDDRWEDGWVVADIGDTTVTHESAPDYRKAIRNHRKQTGDSMLRSSS